MAIYTSRASGHTVTDLPALGPVSAHTTGQVGTGMACAHRARAETVPPCMTDVRKLSTLGANPKTR